MDSFPLRKPKTTPLFSLKRRSSRNLLSDYWQHAGRRHYPPSWYPIYPTRDLFSIQSYANVCHEENLSFRCGRGYILYSKESNIASVSEIRSWFRIDTHILWLNFSYWKILPSTKLFLHRTSNMRALASSLWYKMCTWIFLQTWLYILTNKKKFDAL
jgi:hypothetical protein